MARDPNEPKQPFHLSIVAALEPLTRTRGAWPKVQAQALYNLLDRTIVPAEHIPELLRQLRKLSKKDARIVNVARPIIKRLEKDYREAVR